MSGRARYTRLITKLAPNLNEAILIVVQVQYLSTFEINAPNISIREARKILGITAKGLTDEAIARLVAQVDVLTDIVAAHVSDSKIKSSIDISGSRLHTDE